MKPTFDDPVVEIRAVRQELAEQFGDDVNALCDFLTEREKVHQELLVNYPSKAPQAIPPHRPRETT